MRKVVRRDREQYSDALESKLKRYESEGTIGSRQRGSPQGASCLLVCFLRSKRDDGRMVQCCFEGPYWETGGEECYLLQK